MESSDGRPIPTLSTTSSGKDVSVATKTSSGLNFPDTVKALENSYENQRRQGPNKQIKNQVRGGREILAPRKNKKRRW